MDRVSQLVQIQATALKLFKKKNADMATRLQNMGLLEFWYELVIRLIELCQLQKMVYNW